MTTTTSATAPRGSSARRPAAPARRAGRRAASLIGAARSSSCRHRAVADHELALFHVLSPWLIGVDGEAPAENVRAHNVHCAGASDAGAGDRAAAQLAILDGDGAAAADRYAAQRCVHARAYEHRRAVLPHGDAGGAGADDDAVLEAAAAAVFA